MFISARLAAVLAAASFVAPFAAPGTAFADTSISAAGSTALQPLVQAAADAYQQAHSDIKISVTGGGSRTGLSLVASKSVDLGDSDILAPAGSDALVDHKVAVVGFAVIVNPQSGVTGLSKKQIQDIFALKVKNWKDVGGKDQVITVINRPASSGTRAVFAKTLLGGATIPPSLTEDAERSSRRCRRRPAPYRMRRSPARTTRPASPKSRSTARPRTTRTFRTVSILSGPTSTSTRTVRRRRSSRASSRSCKATAR